MGGGPLEPWELQTPLENPAGQPPVLPWHPALTPSLGAFVKNADSGVPWPTFPLRVEQAPKPAV